MKVVLTSQGSTGDIFPMIGFALALQDAGHSVVLATIDLYKEEIERAGIDFYQLPPFWDQQELSYWMGRLQNIRGPIFQLNELYKAALPYIPEMIDRMEALLEDKDVLVSSYLFPCNKSIADRRGIPFATFAFAHNTVPSKHYPPEDLPRLKWLPKKWQMVWNTWLWRVGNKVIDFVINRTIAKQLEAKRLPKVKDFFSKPAELILVALSPALMQPPYKLDSRFQFVGYSRWQSPSSSELENEIAAFTADGPVPILCFGSMVYKDPEKTMRSFLQHWPKNQKIIIQRGWARFPTIPGYENVRVIGNACHDTLFQHASIVIHHGGAGTTASVLYSGKPQIVVPHLGDQNFFGKEVERLGVGKRCPKKLWTTQLFKRVTSVLNDPRYASRAIEVEQTLQQENGSQWAVQALEKYVAAAELNVTKKLQNPSNVTLVSNFCEQSH
jgi:vancomycin aglycone glucosyltransferase